MVRTWLNSLAGGAVGFLVGAIIVSMMSRGHPDSDTTAITLFVGVFLAGAGAVAGAIIGGAADLLEHFKKREQAGESRQQD
jgi:hypothetical protein